jgi:hypothetical protein
MSLDEKCDPFCMVASSLSKIIATGWGLNLSGGSLNGVQTIGLKHSAPPEPTYPPVITRVIGLNVRWMWLSRNIYLHRNIIAQINEDMHLFPQCSSNPRSLHSTVEKPADRRVDREEGDWLETWES